MPSPRKKTAIIKNRFIMSGILLTEPRIENSEFSTPRTPNSKPQTEGRPASASSVEPLRRRREMLVMPLVLVRWPYLVTHEREKALHGGHGVHGGG